MEKCYCDLCGREIKGKKYHMTIEDSSGWLVTNCENLAEIWHKDYDLCVNCAKDNLPELMEGELCACGGKCCDDACKPSEGHKEEAILVKDIEKWSIVAETIYPLRHSIIPTLLEAARRVFVKEED